MLKSLNLEPVLSRDLLPRNALYELLEPLDGRKPDLPPWAYLPVGVRRLAPLECLACSRPVECYSVSLMYVFYSFR